MLLSMTGFGEARRESDVAKVCVEIRSVNSRYFKSNIRASDVYQTLEAQIETLLRKRLHRGTINLTLRVEHEHRADEYRLNLVALESYRRQVDQLEREWHLTDSVPLADMLALPGVISEDESFSANAEADWPLIRDTVEEAIQRLSEMRATEGRAMAVDLKTNAEAILVHLDAIEARAPVVVESYRDRLHERVKKLLANTEAKVSPDDLIREVSVYAERSDIAEETVRLRSHIEQFEQLIDAPESVGRKLDFLTQEMVREANTIGSKANDVAISKEVVEVKSRIERIREMVQNVE